MKMYSSRFWLYLSLALVALVSFSNAMFGIDRRQADLSDTLGLSAAATTSTSLPQINADPTTSSSSTSSSSSDTSIITSSTPTFIVPPVSRISNQTTTTTTSSSSTPSFTPTPTPSISESPTATVTHSVTTIPASTVVITMTADGSVYTSSSISYSTSTAASGVAAASDSSTSPSGMTSQTRSMIIGITVGIGGAIILAGLAFVAWRIWGKKAPRMDEDEILMAGSNAHGEKLTGSPGSQFKSTLDQYHAHSGTNF